MSLNKKIITGKFSNKCILSWNIIKWKNRPPYVWYDAVEEFENVFLQQKGIKTLYNRSTKNVLLALFHKVFLKLKIRILLKAYKIYGYFKKKNCFAILMGIGDFGKCLPYMYAKGVKAIYMFDAWPQSHSAIELFIKNANIQYAFFSSSEVTNIFKQRLKHVNVQWVPEGINMLEYTFKPYQEKKIDVLQIGRKWDKYHTIIKPFLKKEGYTYKYQSEKNKVIFPDKVSFVEGLANSKISICVPSSYTHPERSGNISTITFRYWQSMASKCLIVGIMPPEMQLLFDYNPMIAIDMTKPIEQLEDILHNYTDYIPLIEKNYNLMLQKHTWRNRADDICGYLNEFTNND